MPGISLQQLRIHISLEGAQDKWWKKQDHTHPTEVCYELCKLSQESFGLTSGGEPVLLIEGQVSKLDQVAQGPPS